MVDARTAIAGNNHRVGMTRDTASSSVTAGVRMLRCSLRQGWPPRMALAPAPVSSLLSRRGRIDPHVQRRRADGGRRDGWHLVLSSAIDRLHGAGHRRGWRSLRRDIRFHPGRVTGAEASPARTWSRAEVPIVTRAEAVQLAHIAKAAEIALLGRVREIYGGWTIERDPHSDARLEGLELKMRSAEEAFWQAKAKLDPGDPSLDTSG